MSDADRSRAETDGASAWLFDWEGWKAALGRIEVRPLDNIGLKGVALALSMLLWLQVNAGQAVPQIVPNVPIELEDVPLHLAVAEPYIDTVMIRVRGMPERVRNLAPGELIPAIDLRDAHAGENIVELTPQLIDAPFGVEVERIEPSEVHIVLETRIQSTVPVIPDIAGSPAEGYEVAGQEVEPPEATISGPRSRVQRTELVHTATVNISGMDETLSQRVTIRVDDPLVEVVTQRSVLLTVEIRESRVTRQFDDVPVLAVGTDSRADVNPGRISVVLRATPTVLGRIERLEAVITAADLEPRAEDYRLEPSIRVRPDELSDEIEVVAFLPQRLIDVHVYP